MVLSNRPYDRPYEIEETAQKGRIIATVKEQHVCQGKRNNCRNTLPISSAPDSISIDRSSNSAFMASILDHISRMRALQTHTVKATNVESITKAGNVDQHKHPRRKANWGRRRQGSHHGRFSPIEVSLINRRNRGVDDSWNNRRALKSFSPLQITLAGDKLLLFQKRWRADRVNVKGTALVGGELPEWTTWQ